MVEYIVGRYGCLENNSYRLSVDVSGVGMFICYLFQCSTAVVQLTVNQLVVGSIPATGAN